MACNMRQSDFSLPRFITATYIWEALYKIPGAKTFGATYRLKKEIVNRSRHSKDRSS